MNNLKILERLQKLHSLILCENTGTPKELAGRLGISKRTVHLMLKELRDLEANIQYSKSRKTYYYKNDFDLKVSVSVCIMSDNQTTKIFGGYIFTRCKEVALYQTKLVLSKEFNPL